MTLVMASLSQWASPSSCSIVSFFSFLGKAGERGEEEISFPVETAPRCPPALHGAEGRILRKAENEEFSF